MSRPPTACGNGPIHGGNHDAIARQLGVALTQVRLDFSVNINPAGPPRGVSTLLANSWDEITRYPDAAAIHAVAQLANAHGVPADHVIAGNGSTEIFFWLAQTLARQAGWIAPTYSGYAEACRAAGVRCSALTCRPPESPYDAALDTLHPSPGSLIFLGTPDNPTGQVLSPTRIRALAREFPDAWFAVDESFMDFLPDSAAMTLIKPCPPENLIVVKSLTKFFAIPGLRLGMAYAHPSTCERIRQASLPWSVNAIAQSVAGILYNDPEYLIASRGRTAALREILREGLQALGWHVFPSCVNFLLACPPTPWNASLLQAELLRHGILIRSCRDFEGLGEPYVRIAVRPDDEIKALLETLRKLRPPARPAKPAKPMAWAARQHGTPAIMVVGTTSHAGKTVFAAGLCRYFQRKGFDVAPFKAQNMALNSFVTANGGEIGRAQAMQAQAARIPPTTDMNPVLLKPTDRKCSQVVVNGQAIGVMNAQSYYAMKKTMREAACAAYDRLAAAHELIILEGAGSPAEINLLEEDFVNMAMAEHAGARVILVADIDRGGVFAAIHGTLDLLPRHFRRLVAGIVINKFRGDLSLLDPGIRQIEQLTGEPVLGVLPYDESLRLEEEDSLGIPSQSAAHKSLLDIAVIRLEHISNYTDFLALEKSPSVSLRYVDEAASLASPDLILLPGTKNTCGDLLRLRESGLADAILAAARRQIPVFGICGGYQMLGTLISDPDGVEGAPGDTPGLGVLDVSTVLTPTKELAQVTGSTLHPLPFARPGTRIAGYEIHAGRTTPGARPAIALTFRRGTPVLEMDGAVSPNGLVCGCYMHGIFDEPEFREQLLQWLLTRRGITRQLFSPVRNSDPFDNLADLLEAHIDMRKIDDWTGRHA